MSKAEKTREYIIEKAAPIFNTKGYAGTSMAHLIEATGLTKGAIYGNFVNKDEVAVAVYKYNVKAIGKKLNEAISLKECAPDKIIAIAEYYRANWRKTFECGGCPILNASIEADDNLVFLKKTVQKSIKNWVISICKIIDDGKQNGEFKNEISATEYAYTIISLIEGGMMLAKIENEPKHLFASLDRIIKIVKQEMIY